MRRSSPEIPVKVGFLLVSGSIFCRTNLHTTTSLVSRAPTDPRVSCCLVNTESSSFHDSLRDPGSKGPLAKDRLRWSSAEVQGELGVSADLVPTYIYALAKS